MANPRPRTRTTAARNLRALMTAAGYSQRDLADKSGVSQRAISNILSESASCSIETLEALGRPFGLTSWQMLLPSLPNDLPQSAPIAELVRAFLDADKDGRELILRVASREQRHVS